MIALVHYLIFFSILLLYTLFDVNYFLRMAFTISWGRLFRKKRNIFEKTTNYGVCLTNDIDIFLTHMNNARYLRELDFARNYFYDRSGFFWKLKKKGGIVVQAATSIRYRRPFPVFSVYKVTTKLIYWEDKNIYIEHELIRLSDNFVHATILSKQSVTGADINIPDIIRKIEPRAVRPVPTEELQLWLRCLEESSLKYKRLREQEAANNVAEAVV